MKLQKYREISRALYADLERVLEKHGLKTSKLSAAVNEEVGTVRLSIVLADANLKDASGAPTTPESERFKRLAFTVGLEPGLLGQQFAAGNGRWFTIVGMKDTRSDKRVLLLRSDGQTFVSTPGNIIRQISMRDRNLADATTVGVLPGGAA